MEETPGQDDPMGALMALSRAQQQRREEALARLRRLSEQQGAQAQGLRNMALLSSFGQNPLLQGLQREAGTQGAQLQGMAMQAEGRADVMDRSGLDPLGIARLQQMADYQRKQQELGEARLAQQQGLAEMKLAQQQEEAAAKAEAARQKATAGAAAAKAQSGKKEDAAGIKLEGDLRKEFQALPAYKNYQLALVAFDQIQRSAKDPSPAGDIAVITNYMRSLDPTTGVKEQEFQNAQSAGGFDDKARAGWERIMSGKRLSDTQRQDFVRAAESNTRALKDPYDRAAKYYKGLAESYKVNPERVGTPVGMDMETEPTQVTAPVQRTPAAQALPPGPGGSLLLGPVMERNTGQADSVRVKINGQEIRLPRANLEAARKRAADKEYSFEVLDG